MPEASRRDKTYYDYLICLECESPCYVFEFKAGELDEGFCEMCGNDDVDTFLPEEDFDVLSSQAEG